MSYSPQAAAPRRFAGGWSRPVLIAVLVGLISIAARVHLIHTRPTTGRMSGQEAESHLLVSNIAMAQSPWRTHYFLPIFTLGAPYNKFIDNHPGAEAHDAEGNYIYTSSPPLAFSLPYFASLLTGGPTLVAQRWLNVVLQVATALLLAYLVYRAGQGRDVAQQTRLLAGSTAFVIYMTAPECLKSHLFGMWGQQWQSLFMLGQIYFFVFRPKPAMVGLLAMLGCLTEWTAYIFNPGLFAVALYSYWKTRDRRALVMAGAILLGCVAGGLAMIGWFTAKMTLQEYFTCLRGRSAYRSEGPLFNLLKFLPRYLNSYGFFALLAAAVLWLRPWRAGWRQPCDRAPVILPGLDPLIASIILLLLSLLEHIAVKGHALVYSFDRLKGVEILPFLVAWAMYAVPARSRSLFHGALAAGALSIGLFCFSYDTRWGYFYAPVVQQQRIGEVMRRTESPVGPSFTNGDVRGAEVYYAGRNIGMGVYGLAGRAGVDVPTYIRQWCQRYGFPEATLYELSDIQLFPSPDVLPRSIKVTRFYVDREPVVLETAVLDERASDYHSNRSFLDLDPIWKLPRNN